MIQGPQNSKSQRLAIAIVGAVSLGSYEAGVMYEIIEAIRQHNENTPEIEKQIKIDVITGASAGAITACILAHKLLYEQDALRDPAKNALHMPWVKQADISNLLNFQCKGEANSKTSTFSILSSEFIEFLGQEYVLKRYTGSNVPTPNPHPAVDKNGLLLGITMSNLNGFDYTKNLTDFVSSTSVNSQPESIQFTYRKHKDRFICRIKSPQQANHEEAKVNEVEQEQWKVEAGDDLGSWQRIEKAARSSGAFPFAFRILDIKRFQREEQDLTGDDVFPGRSGCYAYTDGGTFENEPLGLAKLLVNSLDTEPRDYESRFFLYIAPGPKLASVSKESKASGTSATSPTSAEDKQRIKEDNATYLRTGLALIEAIFTQARFQDWIETSEINDLIRCFDKQSIALKDILSSSPELQLAFRSIAEQSPNQVEVWLSRLYSDAPERQSVDRERLKQQFSEEYNFLAQQKPGDEKVATTWLQIVQALEKVADLRNKDQMRIYTITANSSKLISEGFVAFNGFFSEQFRQYDYDLGRKEARQFLQGIQQLNKDKSCPILITQPNGTLQRDLYLKNFLLSEEPILDERLISIAEDSDSSAALQYVPPKKRREFRDQLLKRVVDSTYEEIAKQKNPIVLIWFLKLFAWLLKPMARWFVATVWLNSLLKLNAEYLPIDS
jgi:predicted acylesterase/phospholipase RssA